MIVFAQCLLEKGLVIPKHHIVRQHRRAVGTFSLAEAFDHEMKRQVRTARLVTPDTYQERIRDSSRIGHDVLPPLLEASVLHWRDRVFTVTGFERVEVSALQEASFRQSWLLRFPTEEELDDLVRDGLPRNPGPLGFGPGAEREPREHA